MTHIEKLLKTRETPKTIRLAGGAANSAVWVQLFADTIGIPVEVVDVKELGTLGCVMAASIAAGIYTDYKDAALHMSKIEKRIEPNPENHTIYKKKYARYKKLIEALGTVEE